MLKTYFLTVLIIQHLVLSWHPHLFFLVTEELPEVENWMPRNKCRFTTIFCSWSLTCWLSWNPEIKGPTWKQSSNIQNWTMGSQVIYSIRCVSCKSHHIWTHCKRDWDSAEWSQGYLWSSRVAICSCISDQSSSGQENCCCSHRFLSTKSSGYPLDKWAFILPPSLRSN